VLRIPTNASSLFFTVVPLTFIGGFQDLVTGNSVTFGSRPGVTVLCVRIRTLNWAPLGLSFELHGGGDTVLHVELTQVSVGSVVDV
jgi:hypothetical protein